MGDLLLRGHPESHRLVDGETDACIEGFPRSANTFAYRAFQEANPDAQVAHHLHTPIQVVRAADLAVPCAVVIRDPLDAITSYLVFAGGVKTPRAAIRRYVNFYARIAPVSDAFVLLRFADVLSDPSAVARALNARFGTSFAISTSDRRMRVGAYARQSPSASANAGAKRTPPRSRTPIGIA